MRLPEEVTVLAPDGSEIRELLRVGGGSFAHCSLPPGAVSLAVRHRTIEELWYFLNGRGQVWRKEGQREDVVDVGPGTCVDVPTGAHFQFRTVGEEPLIFLIATMPPWPGADEAVRVADHWPAE
ncbi:MAG TPA: cupin domain-containing protein [Chloroflexota bacterium]|nr:cupin domain-containing protein [Chloroflexota bacterium]